MPRAIDNESAQPPTCRLIAKRVQGGGHNRIDTNIYVNLVYEGKNTIIQLWMEESLHSVAYCELHETHKTCITNLLKQMPQSKNIYVLELVDGAQVWRPLHQRGK